MIKKSGESLDPTRPALLLVFGATVKKQQPLHARVTVLGRTRGCDIGLEAPEIAGVHCVIARAADGYYLRDCGSRTGTRLNGKTVSETRLHDGDIFQLGPFSFRLFLPPERAATLDPAGTNLRRLERSRRNLSRIALAQRRALRQLGKGEPLVTARQAALESKEAALAERSREYEQRCRHLEKAERDLTWDRRMLDRELAAFQARTGAALPKPAPEFAVGRDGSGPTVGPIPELVPMEEVRHLRKRVDALCRKLAEKDLQIASLRAGSSGSDGEKRVRDQAQKDVEQARERQHLDQMWEELRREMQRISGGKPAQGQGGRDTVLDTKPCSAAGPPPAEPARESRVLTPG